MPSSSHLLDAPPCPSLQGIPELRILLVGKIIFECVLEAFWNACLLALLILLGAREAIHDGKEDADG